MAQFSLPKEFGNGVMDVHDEPFMNLGEYYKKEKTDICYRYVRFAEDVVKGQAVKSKINLYSKTNLSPKTSGGSDFPVAGTRKIEEHDATYLKSLAGLPSGEVPFFAHGLIAINGGTGAGQSGVIMQYSDKQLNIDWYEEGQALKTALGSDTDYVIYAPWYVEDANATESGIVNGIVVAESAKKDEYGFIVESGRERVRPGAAVTAGQALKPGNTTATEGEGVPITAADVYDAYATVEYAGAADSLVWASIYCKPISVIEFPLEEMIRGFEPAEAKSG